MRVLLAVCMLLFSFGAAPHDIYHDWVNKDGKGCCNGTDCKPVPAGYRKVVDGTEYILIHGKGNATGQQEWCPILPRHYLSRGNAPDGSVAHYCVWWGAGSTPCEQFLCFQREALY